MQVHRASQQMRGKRLSHIEVGVRGFCSQSVHVPTDGSNRDDWQRQAQDYQKTEPSGRAGCGYDERRRAGSYRPPHRETVGPLAIRYTWIRPDISIWQRAPCWWWRSMSKPLTTTYRQFLGLWPAVQCTRGSAQQAWENRLETDPQ